MKEECIVLIPCHKQVLNSRENKSLKRCLEILKNYKIVLLIPDSIPFLKTDVDLFQTKIIKIHKKHFENVYSYNKLKTSAFLYKKFSSYKFILTYELDSWIFKDDLNRWCQYNFDYIGAPWFKGFSDDNTYMFNGVGNSGFSLRKVDKMLEIFCDYKNPFFEKNVLKKKIKNVFGWIYYKIIKENYFIQNSVGFHEDTLINSLKDSKMINIPNELTALKFSFEMHPSYLYKLNNDKLPMGCHGWEKYEPDFWSKYIDING
jgi:hypothetical protein